MRHGIACLTVAVLLVSTGVNAYLNPPPLETVIREYDIVVTGMMREIDWIDGRSHCIVTIDVTDVIWGEAQGGDVLTVEWSGYWECGPKYALQLGERIFFLRRVDAGLELETLFIVTVSDRDHIEELLRDLPIRVEPVGDWREDADWGLVDLIYLNVSDLERSFSGVRYEEGRFTTASEDTRLELSSGFGKKRGTVSSRAEAFVVDPSIPDIVVPPRAEIRIRVDIRILFEVRDSDVQQGNGFVFFEVDGAGEGHDRMIHWR